VFLTEHSAARMAVLLLLTIAVALLCYDLFANLGNWLRKVYGPKLRLKKTTDRLGGAAVAMVGCLTAVWLSAAMFDNAAVPLVKAQLDGSLVLVATKTLGPAPTLFTNIGHLLGPFSAPDAFAVTEPGFGSAPAKISKQFRSIDESAVRVAPSLVKIKAWGCGSTSAGSGFVVADKMVITNAHVVAGSSQIYAEDKNGTHTARAIWFDPKLDISVLAVDKGLAGIPLALKKDAMNTGDVGVVLGYANGDQLVANDATVLQLLRADGYDIYGQDKVVRTIYAVRSPVVPGDSGGALIDQDGNVAGLIFGNSILQKKTGYAIASNQITPIVKSLKSGLAAVHTGLCTAQ
jgi:S1-C subfamily serine protease